MTKYRLKKDLPFNDKGSIVPTTIVNDQTADCYFLDNGEFVVTPENLKALVTQGWIEEIKPREFWVEINNATNKATDVGKGFPPDQTHPHYSYIEVIEVLKS